MQSDLRWIVSVPLHALIGTDLFEPVLLKYFPDIQKRITPRLTARDLLPFQGEAQFLEELQQTAACFEEETKREVREFGVDIDLKDIRYQWGTPEINEAVVRKIEEIYPVSQGNIICYGPSNMTFWYSMEQDMLPYHAQNHGMGGCTDLDLIRYAPRILYPYRPSAVIIQTGSNDIASGIPLEEILQRKKEMYALFLRRLPETKLIVCSGLPLPGRMQFWEATKQTNRLLRDLCEENPRLYFLDATDVMMTDSGEEKYRSADGRFFNPDLFRIDRIHLNKKGHDVWTQLMKTVLASANVHAGREASV